MVTKSWLNYSIGNGEVNLDNNKVYRKDRGVVKLGRAGE